VPRRAALDRPVRGREQAPLTELVEAVMVRDADRRACEQRRRKRVKVRVHEVRVHERGASCAGDQARAHGRV
jgi:hypothetical protein